MIIFYLTFVFTQKVLAWPDGAPCIHSVFESLNPLEAVEHQGGLQLTPPPYKIEVIQKCYWKGQPIQLVLKGYTTADRFKGFAIQPISYKGPHKDQRIGQFLRLDDNGSWQQQCFRFKDSVTHSHDERKKSMKLWWRNDDGDSDYIQFVATVVQSQKVFWVKSVLSSPIPPCRMEKFGVTNYVPPTITSPPPVKSFKIETFHLFNGEDDRLQRSLQVPPVIEMVRKPKPQSFEDVFKVINVSSPIFLAKMRPKSSRILPNQNIPPQDTGSIVISKSGTDSFSTPLRIPETQQQRRLTHVIPIPQLAANPPPRRALNRLSPSTVVQQEQFRSIATPQQTNSRRIHQGEIQINPQQPSPAIFANRRQLQSNNNCYDRDPSILCYNRYQFCQSRRYMHINCRKTCRLC